MMKKAIFILLIILTGLTLHAQKKSGGVVSFDHGVIIGANGDTITEIVQSGDLLYFYKNGVITPVYGLEEDPPEPTGDLIINYGFNNSTEDSTDYANDGVPSANFTYISWDELDIFGVASFYFDGQNVTTPSVNTTNSLSIALDWFLKTTNEPNRKLFESDGNFYMNINPTDSSLQFVSFDSPTDSSILETPANAFVIDTTKGSKINRLMLRVNRSEGTGAIYINGVDANAVGSVAKTFTTTGAIVIGQGADGNSQSYVGMDNFKLWTKILTDAEATAEYEANEYYNITPDGEGPILQSAKIESLQPNAIHLTFDKLIYVNSEDSAVVAFSVEKNYDDAVVDVDSIFYNTIDNVGSMVLYTDSLDSEDTVRVNYTEVVSGGVIDIDGYQTATFTDSSVINELCDGTLYAKYPFNDDATDYTGMFDGTASTPSVFSNSSPVEGTHKFVSAAGSSYYIELPSDMDVGLELTMTVNGYLNTNTEDSHVMISNYDHSGSGNYNSGGTNGWDVHYEDVNNRLVFMIVSPGGVRDSAYADIVIPDLGWFHFGVTKSGSKVKFYSDGVDITTDSIIDTNIGYETSGPYYIAGWANHVWGGGWHLDDMHFYTNALSESIIADIYTDRAAGTPYSGCSVIPPKPPSPFSTYADSIWACDFEDLDEDLSFDYLNAEAAFVDGGAIDNSWNYPRGMGKTYTIGGSFDHVEDVNTSIIDVPAVSDGSGEASRVMKFNHNAEDYGLHGAIWKDGTDPAYPATWGSGAQWTMELSGDYYEIYHTFNFQRNYGATTRGNKMPSGSAYEETGIYDGVRMWWVIEEWPNQIPPSDSLDMVGNKSGWYCHAAIAPDGYTGLKYPTNREGEYSYALWDGGSPQWPDPTNTDLYEFDFSDSTWYNVTFRYVAQTAQNYDGFTEVWINGVMMHRWINQRWSDGREPWNWINFQFWIGGDSYKYAPESWGCGDQYLWMDDYYVFQYKTGYGPAEKGVPSIPGTPLTDLPNWNLVTNKKVER